MVRVQDEDAVHGARQHRVHGVGLARHREHHVQEVLRVVQVVLREHEGLTDRVLVGHGGDGRHLRDQAMRGDEALLRVGDVGAVVIEGGERAHHAAHHRHGMRVAPETAEEGRELLMHHGVHGDVALELLLLLGGRQLALGEEVGDLHEIAVLRQVLDRIAAIEQLADVAVDVGDLGFAGAGGGVAGVVGEVAGLGVELADVDHLGADRAGQQRQDRLLAGAVVGQRDVFVRLGGGFGGGTGALCGHWCDPWLGCLCSAIGEGSIGLTGYRIKYLSRSWRSGSRRRSGPVFRPGQVPP